MPFDPLTIGFMGIGLLFFLLALRVPVGFAMIGIGLLGITILQNERAALATLSSETFELATKMELIIIPFFVLMGNLAGISGLSRNLYDAAHAWTGHRKGGLASATIIGCAGFASLSGSSVASAITMGQVALPEMKRFKYDDRLSSGAVAAGGTLGILIPPSTGLVLYSLMTEQSIGQLFVAGFLPGLLLAAFFVLTIMLLTHLKPELGPAGERLSYSERVHQTRGALPFILIIAATIGGIYSGVFTPMEASAVGATGTLIIALLRRSLNWRRFAGIMRNTGTTTVMCYFIIIGANVLNPFLARAGVTHWVSESILGLGLGPTMTVVVIMAAFAVMGTFLEGFAMLVLMVPVFFPVVTALGIDPILFGILVVITLEMGLITPPVGINVFLVKALLPNVPSARIFVGVAPFLLAMLVSLTLLLIFPQITLLLPSTMYR
ncbi:TRAP transporter large permease [Celeribacter indicus]|uniref:TRAP transporter large permease protein n=1 Tax=Celeribacter indicus TaxID=1208324 RepID=A0A0B5E7U1_9RHOB|nr:TRAP transporter large permease [Celeribacter indicus]AJE49480.1 TRAP dicarboxylate transporter subunit DctM [Celeribacter indicus]SDX57377.1 TRAP transporter, DctM subunit [Celeribacter indicus]